MKSNIHSHHVRCDFLLLKFDMKLSRLQHISGANRYIIYDNEDCVEGVDLIPGIRASPNVDNCIRKCEETDGCTGFAFAGNNCYLKDVRCEDTTKAVGTDTFLNKGKIPSQTCPSKFEPGRSLMKN